MLTPPTKKSSVCITLYGFGNGACRAATTQVTSQQEYPPSPPLPSPPLLSPLLFSRQIRPCSASTQGFIRASTGPTLQDHPALPPLYYPLIGSSSRRAALVSAPAPAPPAAMAAVVAASEATVTVAAVAAESAVTVESVVAGRGEAAVRTQTLPKGRTGRVYTGGTNSGRGRSSREFSRPTSTC